MYLNWFSRSNLVKSKPRYVGGVKQSPMRRAERHLYMESMRKTKKAWEGQRDYEKDQENIQYMWVDEWEKCYLGQCVLQAWSQHDAADHCGHQQEDGVPYQLKSGDHMHNVHTQLCVLLLIAYMILLAMEELHMLGQHWQIAQAAEPKQLKRRKVKTKLSSLYFRFWYQMSGNLCVV